MYEFKLPLHFAIEDKYETIEVSYDNTGIIRNIGNKLTFGFVERSYSTIEEDVYIGNNKNEMISNFKSNRLDSFMNVAKDNYNTIEKDFFIPLEKMAKDLKSHIQQLTITVEEFKNNLK